MNSSDNTSIMNDADARLGQQLRDLVLRLVITNSRFGRSTRESDIFTEALRLADMTELGGANVSSDHRRVVLQHVLSNKQETSFAVVTQKGVRKILLRGGVDSALPPQPPPPPPPPTSTAAPASTFSFVDDVAASETGGKNNVDDDGKNDNNFQDGNDAEQNGGDEEQHQQQEEEQHQQQQQQQVDSAGAAAATATASTPTAREILVQKFWNRLGSVATLSITVSELVDLLRDHIRCYNLGKAPQMKLYLDVSPAKVLGALLSDPECPWTIEPGSADFVRVRPDVNSQQVLAFCKQHNVKMISTDEDTIMRMATALLPIAHKTAAEQTTASYSESVFYSAVSKNPKIGGFDFSQDASLKKLAVARMLSLPDCQICRSFDARNAFCLKPGSVLYNQVQQRRQQQRQQQQQQVNKFRQLADAMIAPARSFLATKTLPIPTSDFIHHLVQNEALGRLGIHDKNTRDRALQLMFDSKALECRRVVGKAPAPRHDMLLGKNDQVSSLNAEPTVAEVRKLAHAMIEPAREYLAKRGLPTTTDAFMSHLVHNEALLQLGIKNRNNRDRALQLLLDSNALGCRRVLKPGREPNHDMLVRVDGPPQPQQQSQQRHQQQQQPQAAALQQEATVVHDWLMRHCWWHVGCFGTQRLPRHHIFAAALSALPHLAEPKIIAGINFLLSSDSDRFPWLFLPNTGFVHLRREWTEQRVLEYCRGCGFDPSREQQQQRPQQQPQQQHHNHNHHHLHHHHHQQQLQPGQLPPQFHPTSSVHHHHHQHYLPHYDEHLQHHYLQQQQALQYQYQHQQQPQHAPPLIPLPPVVITTTTTPAIVTAPPAAAVVPTTSTNSDNNHSATTDNEAQVFRNLLYTLWCRIGTVSELVVSKAFLIESLNYDGRIPASFPLSQRVAIAEKHLRDPQFPWYETTTTTTAAAHSATTATASDSSVNSGGVIIGDTEIRKRPEWTPERIGQFAREARCGVELRTVTEEHRVMKLAKVMLSLIEAQAATMPPPPWELGELFTRIRGNPQLQDADSGFSDEVIRRAAVLRMFSLPGCRYDRPPKPEERQRVVLKRGVAAAAAVSALSAEHLLKVEQLVPLVRAELTNMLRDTPLNVLAEAPVIERLTSNAALAFLGIGNVLVRSAVLERLVREKVIEIVVPEGLATRLFHLLATPPPPPPPPPVVVTAVSEDSSNNNDKAAAANVAAAPVSSAVKSIPFELPKFVPRIPVSQQQQQPQQQQQEQQQQQGPVRREREDETAPSASASLAAAPPPANSPITSPPPLLIYRGMVVAPVGVAPNACIMIPPPRAVGTWTVNI